MRYPLLALLCLWPSLSPAGPPPTVTARDLPRFPPVEPANAAATFQVKPGFHVELVAAEPLVTSPIAICFDENGRLFVLEMRDYPEQRELHPHLGRVRMLEDTKGDGHYDKATIFCDDLPWPTGLMWANGGLYVAATPDIWRFEDTQHTGHADKREVVFTGFNTGAPRLNVQELPNCLQWGPDNLIHLQVGSGNRGLISSPKNPGRTPEELAARDFWFNPKTYDFGFEAGGGQYGMSYDDVGRRFVCNNSDHLRTYLFDSRYGARNPFFSLPSPLVSIAADGPAAEVFRVSPDEPWRVIRTRWRVAGTVPGLIEGGGRVSGYFTGATGTTVYRGDAFPPSFRGNTFTGDVGGGLVHRKVLRPDGVSLIGERPPDEQKMEFVASRDTWFRPVIFANAPDGALYIVDMYREVIEHPWSIPEQIKQLLDLTSGRDRGRIWRLCPDGFQPKPPPHLGSATTAELVKTLAHPNGWHADTASRLLWERNDPDAPALLRHLLGKSFSPLARLRALRALAGADALAVGDVIKSLTDPDPAVRELAVLLCERFAKDPGLVPTLRNLAADPAPRVRLQLAFTLGSISGDDITATFADLASRDATDPWISAAILSAPPERAARLFARLIKDAPFATGPGEPFLGHLAAIVGARHDGAEIEEALSSLPEGEHGFTLLAGLAEGLARAHIGFSKAYPKRADAILAQARAALQDPQATPARQLAAAHFVRLDPHPETTADLLALLGRNPSLDVTSAILAALDAETAPEVTQKALQAWAGFDLPHRTELAHFLLQRPARARELVVALRDGRVKPDDLPPDATKRLREFPDHDLAAQAAELLPKPAAGTREEVIHQFEPSLQLTGDREKGHLTYQQRCSICHRLHGEGNAFGPDLESVIPGGKDKILTDLLDPNREVAPQYAAYTIELKDGGTMAGILAAETATQITVREPLGKETLLPREKVARFQTTGRSPMPEGLEAGLKPQDIADLLAYITGK